MCKNALLWAASLMAIGQIAFPQIKKQTIDLIETDCRTANESALAQFVDIKTGTILNADAGLKLVRLLLESGRSNCLTTGPSYVIRNFPGLVNRAYKKAGDELLDQKRLEAADFIIHVARWVDPPVQSDNSANGVKLNVEQQRWYLIHKKQFLRPGRMFGAKTVYFIYLHLNKNTRTKYTVQYRFGITQAVPQNEQNLQLLASIVATGSSQDALAGLPTLVSTDVWGGMQLDMWYSAAEITVDASVTDRNNPNSPALKLDNSLNVHNEPLEWWDVSAGLPIRKMSQLSFQSSRNTLVPPCADKKSIFALLDFYPLHKQRMDLAYGNFRWIPSLLVGLPVSQQPLHRPLFAVGWGPRFAQFYAGVVLSKQISLPSGGALAPGAKACTGWCPQFAFGLNLPAKALRSALSSKPAASGGNGNSQEGAGNNAETGAQPSSK